MAKPGQRAEINTFIQGLITEASPLNFPPNASKDEQNFELFRDGTRKRRLGIEDEDPATTIFGGLPFPNDPNQGKNVFLWKTVEGVIDRNFMVLQLGNKIKIFDRSNPALSVVSQLLNTINFGFPATVKYSFTSINGKLIVAAGQDTVGVVSYTGGTTFAVEYKRLLVRDFWGIEAKTDVNYETDTQYRGGLDVKHVYNLQNQSWGIPRKDSTGTLIDPIGAYTAEYSFYPSNSEVVWTGIAFQAVSGAAAPFERIYPNLYSELFGAGVTAPKGYFIIDLLSRGASRSANVAANYVRSGSILSNPTLVTNADITTGGASVVCEFAGRVWYAGFGGGVTDGDKRSPNLTNYVCFSQLVKSMKEIEKCYQEGDPTSREGSDIVDTDGGYLRISGANRIIHMALLARNLVIFADNGVWAISGGGDNGFSASNYEVIKLSTFGCISSHSAVANGSQIFYWGKDGIYAINQDKFAQLQVTSITQVTIQSMYNDIPLASKQKSFGVFDEKNQRVSWIYKTGPFFTLESVVTELVLDTTINAFYKNNIASYNNPSTEGLYDIVASVYDGEVKYVTVEPTEAVPLTGRLFFATYSNTSFRDWKRGVALGVDAKAYVLTGSQIAGDSAIAKQTPYLVMHFKKTEFETNAFGVPTTPSGCLYRCQWDWADGVQSNKFSALAQAYRYRKPYFAALPDTTYDNGFETVTSKNKVRGRGRAFALYFESEPDKDCQILGWNLTINGNALA